LAFAQSTLPFNVIESTGMRELLLSLHPTPQILKLPTRRQLRTLLVPAFEFVLDEHAKAMSHAEHLTVGMRDSWCSARC
jgi:hypothetical protein